MNNSTTTKRQRATKSKNILKDNLKTMKSKLKKRRIQKRCFTRNLRNTHNSYQSDKKQNK